MTGEVAIVRWRRKRTRWLNQHGSVGVRLMNATKALEPIGKVVAKPDQAERQEAAPEVP